MLTEYYEQIELLATDFTLGILFLLIGLAIRDVLKRSAVPKFGRIIVWMVLFLGCFGFIAKGIIQVVWESGI
jgi:vacuolar-type H+-ATPase subunit I/STV1